MPTFLPPPSTGAAEILAWAAKTFPGRVTFASSLGAEDQVLLHLIAEARLDIPIFTLDTGRLFPETYDLVARIRERYGLALRVFFPQSVAVESLVQSQGIDGFRHSVEARKACCQVRKLEPLSRALHGLDAWITGLRSGQAATRQAVAPVERDAAHDRWKINPLHAWSREAVWEFLRQHRVPWHPLHDRGFASIGCACCTRPIHDGEDERAGRWWWESPEHKECGLHRRP